MELIIFPAKLDKFGGTLFLDFTKATNIEVVNTGSTGANSYTSYNGALYEAPDLL